MTVNIKVEASFWSDTSPRAGKDWRKVPEELLYFTTDAPECQASAFSTSS